MQLTEKEIAGDYVSVFAQICANTRAENFCRGEFNCRTGRACAYESIIGNSCADVLSFNRGYNFERRDQQVHRRFFILNLHLGQAFFHVGYHVT
jgi:hypothetical protein